MENNEEVKPENLKIQMLQDTKESRNGNKKNVLLTFRSNIKNKYNRNKSARHLIGSLCAHATVLLFTAAAILHWYKDGQKPLSIIDGLGFYLFITLIFYWSLFYYKFVKPVVFLWLREMPVTKCDRFWIFASWLNKKLFYTVPPTLFFAFLIYDTRNDRRRLISLSGIFVIFSVGYLFSKYPSQIRWDIIYRGVFVQVLLALCTVRWEAGRQFFEHVGTKIEIFLSYSYAGAAFVYSDNLIYVQTVFAFHSLSVIFFVNFIIEILFYYRILQIVFTKLGWFLQKAIGTTSIETINCCVSVFLGLNEALLIIKMYIKDLTLSELQAVLLGALSTVAGSVFAAYVSFGVKAGYLVTASLMSAPAALSLSKLLYPETENSKTNADTILIIDDVHKGKLKSALSAGCEGALSAVNIVTAIIASLIAFISFVTFVNATVTWLGELVGYENVTIITILGKCLMPVAFLIGIDPSQCELVSNLIATKAVLNEFVAYQKLGEYKKMNLLSKKSEAIATYALCSFSNPSSVASILAMISFLCPEQLENSTKLIFRAYIGGVVTCLMTACIAGLLTPSDDSITMISTFNSTNNASSIFS